MSIRIIKINKNISKKDSLRIMTRMWQGYVATKKKEANIPIINAKELRKIKTKK